MKLLSRIQNVLGTVKQTERERAWLVGIVAIVIHLVFVGIGGSLLEQNVAVAQEREGSRSTEAEVVNPPRGARTASAQQAANKPPRKERLKGHIYAGVLLRTTDNVNDKVSSKMSIIAIDPATGEWKRLVDDARVPRVSPDGQTLAFRKDDSGIWNCDTQRAENPAQISTLTGVPLWSPDGEFILTSRLKARAKDWKWSKYETWRFPNGGGVEVPFGVPGTDRLVDWSPDGKWLVTESEGNRPDGRRYQLYVMRTDGGEARRITKFKGAHPRFAPDSRRIVYLHMEYPRPRSIRVVHRDGGNERVVFQEESTEPNVPCWSPDGKWLAFVVMDNEIDAEGRRVVKFDTMHPRIMIVDQSGEKRRELKTKQDDAEVISYGFLDWR